MDWQGNSSEANKTVELAVVKVEAAVPVTDATYGGAVVLNPGKHDYCKIMSVETSPHTDASQAVLEGQVLAKCFAEATTCAPYFQRDRKRTRIRQRCAPLAASPSRLLLKPKRKCHKY